jgi:adenylate cyclase
MPNMDMDTAKHEDLLAKISQLEEELARCKQANNTLLARTKTLEKDLTVLKKVQAAAESGTGSTRKFNMVTVLYASIRGFGVLKDQDNANTHVDELDKFYCHIEEIADKNGIKAIRSIGDTFMCAGGMPRKNRTNPIEIVMASLEIQNYLRELTSGQSIWSISLGIHTGPVHASITGKKKISYELKGETVNIAHRIDSAIETGKVIISAMTHEFVRPYFDCEYIGSIPVKYTGDIALYEVTGFQERFRLGSNPLKPNKSFGVKFGFIRFDDLEEYILNRLEKELPKHLYYHNVKHTMDVTIGVEIIGAAEGVSEEELLLLKTAALFHDMGQIVQSKGHEEVSCKFARDILPNYKYTEQQIQTIEDIIMATQLPPKPKCLLGKIICDADLDYLGRTDFIPVSDTLYRELHEQNIIGNINDWNKIQINFISGHQYFTEFARNSREVNKQKQIDRLKKIITD